MQNRFVSKRENFSAGASQNVFDYVTIQIDQL